MKRVILMLMIALVGLVAAGCEKRNVCSSPEYAATFKDEVAKRYSSVVSKSTAEIVDLGKASGVATEEGDTVCTAIVIVRTTYKAGQRTWIEMMKYRKKGAVFSTSNTSRMLQRISGVVGEDGVFDGISEIEDIPFTEKDGEVGL